MSPYIEFPTNRRAAKPAARIDLLGWTLVALPHAAVLVVMVLTEGGPVAQSTFLGTWALFNCFWLVVLRRPAVAGTLSLGMIVALIQLSRLKYEMIWMTANFLDVWILDTDSISYALSVMPTLDRSILLSFALPIPILALVWWLDPFRVQRRWALLGAAPSLALIVAVSLANPQKDWEAFFSDSYVSKFARSGVDAVPALMTQGYLESEPVVADHLKTLPETICAPLTKPPHIILVHDESSFDARVLPNAKVPPGYGSYFASFDGRQRNFVVEGAGGPSWYTEYNVMAGLSARSFGRFAYHVTRIAAGRVERGLPAALQRCGYDTFTIFPALGAFMSAKAFQTAAGVRNFLDRGALGTDGVERDQFYFNAARRTIERERSKGPLFLYVYLAANHYPWDYRWHPELLPHWKDDPANDPRLNEYLRRQAMTARDYAAFLGELKRDFPDERFLIVRYGDHQPDFASALIEPNLSDSGIAKRLMNYDARYFTTYYAINAVNFEPSNLTSALETIEAPYLPLIVQETAGLPLDASFAEQKRVLERCRGQFYACADGREARRFNRLLIDAGLIKRL